MNTFLFRLLILLLAAVCVCWAEEGHDHDNDHDADGDHAGHSHGGPSKQMTFTSLALTASGGILVSAALLAVLWKPIDGAFRRSRYRTRWEQRNFRIVFAVIVIAVVTGGLGGFAIVNFNREQREQVAKLTDALQPQHGGVVREVDRFAVELLVRRTGEIRLYMRILSGGGLTRYDVKADLVIESDAPGFSKQSVAMKMIQSGEYLVAAANLAGSRQVAVHTSLRVKEQKFEIDFDVPVQD